MIKEEDFISPVRGDANGDVKLRIADVIMLQKRLWQTGNLAGTQNWDLCEDKVINVLALTAPKRDL